MKLCAKHQATWKSWLPRQKTNMDLHSMEVDLRSLCKQGELKEAINILELMDAEGIQAHSNTCMLLLQACINLKALAQAKHVHSYIMQSGFKPSMFLDTRLIDMHAKYGSIDNAREVFNSMSKRDVVSWNALIAGYAQHEAPRLALEMFFQMGQDGVVPDEVTFVSVLKACGRMGNLEQGKHMHGHMIRTGIRQDLGINNTLIDMYAKCGSMNDAYRVFEIMPMRSVVSWTAIIAAYAKHGHGKAALTCFYNMQKNDVKPDEVTFLSVLNACATIGNLDQGKQVHTCIMQSGIRPTLLISNALVDMYAKCGSMEHALQVFDSLCKRDVISWTAMIAGYVKLSRAKEALDFYGRMCQEGVKPNEVTFLSILNACAELAALDEGKEIHALIYKTGIKPNILMESTLVNMYAKCGCIETAQEVFAQMQKRDSVAWNAMITGFNQHGYMVEAFGLFHQMKQEGLEPDEGTYVNILNACATVAALDKGREIHVHINRSGFNSDVFIGSALIDMYSKCGDLKSARKVFDALPNRDVVLWTALVTGYAQHGLYQEALKTIEQMHREGVQLNDVSFLKVLSACSHAGLVEEGCFLFAYMILMNGIRPRVEHFTCIVDLLGRAGRLEEAGYIITEMTCRPTAEIWMALLGACRIYGHAELAGSVADCILKLEPYNTSAIVLLANIYAAAEMWVDQEKVMKTMMHRGAPAQLFVYPCGSKGRGELTKLPSLS